MARPKDMRYVLVVRCVCLALAGVCLLVAGCDSSGSPIEAGNVYVPHGWHLVRFRESVDGIHSAGIEVSNVRLPRPVLQPRAPVQVSGEGLPATAVGLVIATDDDPHLERSSPVGLPLAWPDGSTEGSALGGAPTLQVLFFQADGTDYVATIKLGAKVPRAATKAVGRVIRSIH